MDKNKKSSVYDYGFVDINNKLSNAVITRCHRYYEIAKAMYGNGITSHGRTFNCTFVASGRKLIAIGVNNYLKPMEWHPKLGKIKIFGTDNYNMSLHSEIDAILKLNKDDCSNLSFYNIHLDKSLRCKNSAPCINCFFVARKVGFKNFYFFDENAETFLTLH